MYKDDLLDEDLKEETNKYIDKMLKTSFMIDEGSVFPYPRKKSERIYISAHQRLSRLLNRQYPSLTIEC